MKLAKTAMFLATAFALAGTPALHAQKKPAPKKQTSKSSSRSSLTSSSPITTQGNYGFGVKLGDPTGFTFKTYKRPVGLELNIGRAYYGSRYWNEDRFYKYGKYSDRYYYNYYGYNPRYAPLSIQLHLLAQRPLNSLPELSLYVGAGPQFRATWAEYIFDRKVYYGPDKDDYNWVRERDVVMNPDFGVDFIIGMEYIFKELPLALSFDGGFFMEIWDNPAWITPQASLGIKYVF